LKRCRVSPDLAVRFQVEAQREYFERSSKPLGLRSMRVIEDLSGKVVGACLSDDVNPELRVHGCILLYSCPGTRVDREYIGLLIDPVRQDSNVFRRVGLVRFNEAEYFDLMNPVVITLV